MKEYYEHLDENFENKTQQGSALEELAELILKCTKGFYVTRKIKTGTNQLDCTVRNDYDIKLTVYNELSSILVVECKNEKGIPGNTYYYKLQGIIQRSTEKGERGIGILFSRDKIASTCKQIARDFFVLNNIILINFCDLDLNEIVNGFNFLVKLQEKIQTVKYDIRTDPKKHKLYKSNKK